MRQAATSRAGLLVAVLLLGLMGFTTSAFGSDRPVLNVLVPLGSLSASLVNSFEKETGALVRTGFLTAGTDTDGRVRHDATVWDVVVSDELELRKLERSGRLAPLSEAASGPRYVSLFEDPVGLACKRGVGGSSDDGVRLRWQELSESLVESALIGEVVLALPEPVHALLADSLLPTHAQMLEPMKPTREIDGRQSAQGPVQGSGGAPELRAVYPAQPSLQDPRIAWLGRLYRETRQPLLSVDAEILSPSVSCVITYFSKFNRLLSYFGKPGEVNLRFYVPDGKTIVRRLAVALTEESPKLTLARRFVDRLIAERVLLAARKGFCSARTPKGAPGAGQHKACSATVLRAIDELPVLPENVARALAIGYRGFAPEKQQGNASP